MFRLRVSLSKNIFIFKCGCLSGSNNLNLHLEIAFLNKSRACKNFKILCPSVLTIVALYLTLKQVIFFHRTFHDAALKILFEPWTLLVEINLHSKKWLVSGSYDRHLNSIQNNLVKPSKTFDLYSSKYENFIVLGDFNAEMTNTHMEELC